MKIKIFIDTADLEQIKKYRDKVDGFTTNPTLMRRAGIVDYEKWAKEVLKEVKNKPVSFEVLSNNFNEIGRQTKKISNWGENVYVKIPRINIKDLSLVSIIEEFSREGIKINVTAAMLPDHLVYIRNKAPMIFSLFCGRIADTGLNPASIIKEIIGRYAPNNDKVELLWASCREVLNIYQAEEAGVDIITVTPEIFEKYEKFKDMSLQALSLLTVKQFYEDGKASGYTL
ncbi:MAG: transaldolase family protein [Nanoarchaeota archaeon]